MDDEAALRRPIGWWLKEADSALNDAFDAALGPHGVGWRGWQVLTTLARGGVLRAELLTSLASFDPVPVVDEVIDDLCARGWAEESAGVLELTAAGRSQEQALAPVVDAVRQQGAVALPQDDYVQLVSLLARLVSGLRPTA